MAMTQTEQMIDILSWSFSRPRRSYINETTIPKEMLFLYGGIERQCIIEGYVGNKNRLIEEKIKSELTETENESKHIRTVRPITCTKEIIYSTFMTAFKHVRSQYPEDRKNSVWKWKKDGKTYYIGENMLFDDKKKLVFSIEGNMNFEEIINNTLVIDVSVILKNDYMSKLIKNTLIPACAYLFYGNIIFKDIRKRTPDFNDRFLKTNELSNLLNEKLHKMIKMSCV